MNYKYYVHHLLPNPRETNIPSGHRCKEQSGGRTIREETNVMTAENLYFPDGLKIYEL